MKNNNSNKKAVTILSLAMVLALPITSNADGQETEENAQSTPNYTGAGTETKLEEEIKNILAEEPEITLTVEKEVDKDLTLKENNNPISSTEKPAEVSETTSVDESASDLTTENKEEATLAEETEDQTAPLKEDEATNEDELELSEEEEPEALAAEEENREAKDISNEVQSKYVALTEEGHETKGTIKPDNGEAIGWEVSFTSPRGTIAGDYFTIDLSENLSLKGIEPDHENEYPIEIDGKVVADGVRVDRSTIKYTFNENINDERNVVVSVKGFAYIDKTKVPNNTPEEKISIKVGDTVDEHNINVEYGDPYYTGNNLNGMS